MEVDMEDEAELEEEETCEGEMMEVVWVVETKLRDEVEQEGEEVEMVVEEEVVVEVVEEVVE